MEGPYDKDSTCRLDTANGSNIPATSCPPRLPKTKTVACRRCHSRKVRCSGSHPCQNCREAGLGAQCAFPQRSRQVKVAQSYIDGLLEEIQRLECQVSSCAAQSNNDAPATLPPLTGVSSRRPSIESGDPVRNVTIDVRPWFINTNVTDTPILMAAVADAAFATRFRQVISDPQAPQHKHIPRVNYATDRQLMALSNLDVKWPGPSQRRFLVEVALQYLSRVYHVVRRSAVLENVEKSIQDPKWGDYFQRCKLLALFAVGELYSSRSASEKDFPGMAYFAKAAKILGHSHERPNVEAVETRIILSFYSLALNRRYSAYSLSGTAMRMAIVIGLHLHIPPSQLGDDPAVCEHRKRVFWTAYIIDRMGASMLGHPPGVQDEEIDIGLPSNVAVDPAVAGDFADADYYIANLQLAGVITRVIRSIYGRRNTGKTFTTRVQQALTDLRAWVGELPSHLHVDAQGFAKSVPKPVSLHLSFNQCAILTTRPVLLHVLRKYMDSWPQPIIESQVPASAITLAETCIRCARHSIRLLTQAWIDGSFATFDFSYTQYLFSALLVLAVSSVLGMKESPSDREAFEDASRFLEQLKEAGNFAAHEFWQHIDATRTLLKAMDAKLDTRSEEMAPRELFQRPLAFPVQTATTPTTAAAGMALMEPSLQELLAQPSLDLQFLEGSMHDACSEGLYWPDLSAESWMPDGWAPT